MSNHARVLFFATIRDKAGVRETSIEIPDGATISDVKAQLVNLYPSLEQSMESIIVAMNHEFAFDDAIVLDGAEIALFPPVSGGDDKDVFPTVVALVNNEIDIQSELNKVVLNSTGASCIFTGIVRGETSRGIPHNTDELEYEAYEKMAEAKMSQIAHEIRSRWKEVEGIAIIQRIGKLFPKEISVIVACTSSHRDSGIFEATHYGIDRLKEIVPIWKKEVSKDGQEWIEGEYFPHKGE